MHFVDREREIKILDELWNRPGRQFLVLCGRRRVGKTALLLHWGAERPMPFRTAHRTSSANLLRDFSQAVYRFEHPDEPLDASFSYPFPSMRFASFSRVRARSSG